MGKTNSCKLLLQYFIGVGVVGLFIVWSILCNINAPLWISLLTEVTFDLLLSYFDVSAPNPRRSFTILGRRALWLCKLITTVDNIARLAGFKFQGRTFSKMIRIQARKSELQAESRSYVPKVRVTAGQTRGIRTNRPEKGPEWGLGVSTETPP